MIGLSSRLGTCPSWPPPTAPAGRRARTTVVSRASSGSSTSEPLPFRATTGTGCASRRATSLSTPRLGCCSQGSGHGVIFRVGSGVVFDLVSQDEVGAGVAGVGGSQVLTEFSDGGGGPLRWEGVEPDGHRAVAGVDVAA